MLFILLIILILIILIIEIIESLKRNILSRNYYKKSRKLANLKNKKLIVIGDPCRGNVIKPLQKIFPNAEHGDITIDLFGCDKCLKMDINDIKSWEKFETNKYVVFETATLSFGKDIGKIIEQIKRISGGDFYSAGGYKSFLWKILSHKFYSLKYKEPLTCVIYPYKPTDKKYKIYCLKSKKYKYY